MTGGVLQSAPGVTCPPPPPSISLLGVRINRVTLAQAADHIVASIAAGQGGWVLTPNLDILRRIVRDRDFAGLIEPTTLRLADGMPLVWASRLRRTPLPERVAGSDLIWALCERAAKANQSVFLLGGNPGAADAAAAILTARSPGLKVAGTACPPPGFERDNGAVESIGERLQAERPDIVLVALGSPKQERLISVLRHRLPGAWFLGVGITFSFVSGEVRRAPRWMRRVGLEWIHRLAQEPRRLAKRYLVHGIPFALRLLAISTLEGAGRAQRGVEGLG